MTAFQRWFSAWHSYEPEPKVSALTPAELVDLDSGACRTEIADYLAGKPGARLEDVYWFARLAAHFARRLNAPADSRIL